MLISYNWLRELTATSLTPDELRERLTMVGLAIDAVENVNGDFVLDVEVPSNRPDCLSHIGIAREVAVIDSKKVNFPESRSLNVSGHAEEFAAVEIRDEKLCPRYAARVVRGVSIAPSPAWLVERLSEIGQRSINNVADITNYVLHEMGQPLHAFDLAKLADNRIVVRRADRGESLRTLDGVERKLDEQMLVIADAHRPVALAGIMGGEDSEISIATTEVLIESAYFDPDSVRRTARKLGMDTEASRRFERGADRENVLRAQTRCIELICEVAGGVATENAIDVYPQRPAPRKVAFRPARVKSLTSLEVDLAEMERILQALGFVSQDQAGESISFVVPTWRVDVSQEEDLVEEVARHAGYDKIRSELPPAFHAGEYQPTELKRRTLRRSLKQSGFVEAINFSFIENQHDQDFDLIPALGNSGGEFVTLKNPIIEEAARMRPTLLPGLLQNLRHNLNQNLKDVCLFEIGRVFVGSAENELPHEREALALIATGGVLEAERAQTAREIDFFDLKGALEAAVEAMKLRPLQFTAAPIKHLRQGQAAKIFLAHGIEIGTIGRLAESLAAAYKFRQPVYVAEIDLDALLAIEDQPALYRPLPRYPAVIRDISLLLDRSIPLDRILRAINESAPQDYQGARLVGTYEGEEIKEGKRSITLRVEYRSDEGTLRDDDVEERQQELVSSLLVRFHAELH